MPYFKSIPYQSKQLQGNKYKQPEIQHAIVESELNKVCKIDPGLVRVIRQIGYPEPRIRSPGFSTLVEIINAQQLSTKAASAIWNRLVKLNRGVITPRKMMNRTSEQLRQCGLSAKKIIYIKALAERVLTNNLILENLQALPDQELIAELIEIKGVGPWSAQIYAMFALGRKDMFPANDLALQVAVQRYKNLRNRPDENGTRRISESWAPHRSAVAVLMWKYYGAAVEVTTAGIRSARAK